MRTVHQQLLLLSIIILLFASFVGTIITVHPIYIKQFVREPELVGLIASIVYLVELTLSVPIGVLSDRIGRKALLIISLLTMSFVLSAFFVNSSVHALILLQIAFGASMVPVWTTGEAFIKDISPIGRRGEFRSFFGTFVNTGMLIGPVIGGYLASNLGIRFPYIFASFWLIAPLILSFRVREERSAETFSLGEVTKTFLRHGELKILAFCSVSLYFWYASKWTFGPLLLADLGYGTHIIGIWLGVSVIPFLIFQIPIGKLADKLGKTKMMYLGFLISAIFLVPLGFLGSISGLLLLVFIVSIGTTFVEPLIEARVTDIVPKEQYGGYSGIFELAKTLGLMLGPLISSIFVHFFALSHSFIPAAILFSVAVIIILGQKLPTNNG